jgi:hypothetical protein
MARSSAAPVVGVGIGSLSAPICIHAGQGARPIYAIQGHDDHHNQPAKSLVSPAGSLLRTRGRQFSILECSYGKLAKKKISCHPYTQKISHRSDDWFSDTTTVPSHVAERSLARLDFAGCGETALNVSEKCEGCLKLVAQDRGGLVIDHGMLKFLCRSCIKDRN